MTLSQRYADLAQPLTAFGKTYPAPIKELTIPELQNYAANCISSGFPMLKSIGYEINRDIFNAGYDLNGTI